PGSNAAELVRTVLSDPRYEVVFTNKRNFTFDFATNNGIPEDGIRRVGGFASSDKKIYLSVDANGRLDTRLALEEVFHQLVGKNYNQPGLKIPVQPTAQGAAPDIARKQLLMRAIEGDMTRNPNFDAADFQLQQYARNEYPAEGPVKMLVEMAMGEIDPTQRAQAESMRLKYPRLAFVADRIVADQVALTRDGRLPTLDAKVEMDAMEARVRTAATERAAAERILNEALEANRRGNQEMRDRLARLRPARPTANAPTSEDNAIRPTTPTTAPTTVPAAAPTEEPPPIVPDLPRGRTYTPAEIARHQAMQRGSMANNGTGLLQASISYQNVDRDTTLSSM
ncbi:MAG: hypothetical protein K2Q01_07850, partial [Rickettsiales bacterium]|nr:hypothetical protein [Rickettsiales bacterium]